MKMRTLAIVVLSAGLLAAAEPKDSYAFRMRSLPLAADQTKDTNMFTVRSFQACASPCAIPLLQFNENNVAHQHNKMFFFKSDRASPAAPAKNQ